jgi:tetratricopeptide (TPR) repeat protein
MSEIPIVSLEFRWQKQVESARAAFERGYYAQAVDALVPVLRKFPACLSVRRLLLAARVKSGRSNLGMVRTLTAPFSVWRGRAKLKGDPIASISAADALLVNAPNHRPALILLGNAALRLQWFETAVFAFEKIREVDPDNPDALQGLATALLSLGRAGDAEKVARSLVELRPNDAEAQSLFRNASIATTVAKGKWDAGGDYRAKLEEVNRVKMLEQAAKHFPKPGKPKAP